jgi:osmotically-inducible protein OsmY
MAERHEDRYRGERYSGERGYVREEPRFGDEEAERRRRVDDAERRRERESERLYRRDYGPYDRGWASEDRPVARGYGGETGRDTSWSGPSSAAYSQYASRGVPWADTGWERTEWQGRGAFAGRGPKGYQRSDERIREDVCDRLTDAADIDASEIEVNVANGEVTLSGTVRGRDEKRRSEDLAESIGGVRDVHNNLRVAR